MATLINHCVRRYLAQSCSKSGKPIVVGPSGVTGGQEGGFKIWRNLTFLVAFPAIAICAVGCYLDHQEHHERPKFVKYEYLRIRSKRFPWGEGQKSLFHNPHVNALPDGYEDETEGGH